MADTSALDRSNINSNENVIRPKLNKSKSHLLRNAITEFTQRSTIHGVCYLGDQKLYRYEQFWWGFLLLSSVMGCGLLIYQTYVKWDENPIIVSFATKQTSVWDVPFPSITICPQRKIKQEFLNASDFCVEVNLPDNSSFDVDYHKRDIFQVMAFLMDDKFAKIYWPSDRGDTANGLIEKMRYLAPAPNETFYLCGTPYVSFTCNRTIITDAGVCFALNMIEPNHLFRDGIIHNDITSDIHDKPEWTRDKGFETINNHYYPFRSFYYKLGIRGFITSINTDADKEYIRGQNPHKTGYTIFVHPFDEIPNDYRHTFKLYVQNIEDTLIAITPNMITTSPELRSYSPKRRMCYYSDEKYLSMFKIYTQSNCEIECLANLTLKICGCVKFSMPRNHTTDICGYNKIDCVAKASLSYFEPNSSNSHSLHSLENSCDCLPSCTQISYTAEPKSKGNGLLLDKIYSIISKKKNETGSKTLSMLTFDYKSHSFEAGVRSERFGMNDFLASCGGFLGLFMGVSLVSILEIIYFFTVRLYVNVGSKSKVSAHTEGN